MATNNIVLTAPADGNGAVQISAFNPYHPDAEKNTITVKVFPSSVGIGKPYGTEAAMNVLRNVLAQAGLQVTYIIEDIDRV